MHHRSLALTLVGAMTASLLALVASPAHANVVVTDEIFTKPTSGEFAIQGHGWGHGRGMSQHGARNAADSYRKKTADEITAFYYPGTAKGDLPNTPMRVRLMADNDHRTEVYPASGLVLKDLATGDFVVLPDGRERWRTFVDSAGLHIQDRLSPSGPWRNWAFKPRADAPARSTFVGPIQFEGSPTVPAVRVAFPDGTSRDYRGQVRAVRLSATTAATIDVLPMETYLRGVVPRESISSWALEALKAQAIAARSYSGYQRAHSPAGRYYDICDTTACQVFGGTAVYVPGKSRELLETSKADQAVSQTARVVRTYRGEPIFAEYSSSNGGWSTAGTVAGEVVPYIKAQADPWDGAAPNDFTVGPASVHAWTATLKWADIQAYFNNANNTSVLIGTLQRMRVTERDGNGDWRGRVKKVVLEGVNSSGAATSITTTGAAIYNVHPWPKFADGLRSSWWRVVPSFNASIVSQSTAPRLVQSPGVSTGTLTVTLKNTGNNSWPASGLHLAVSSPVGQADPLVGNKTQPGTYTGTATSIAPNATATFSFALTGDGVAPGLHARSYRLRIGTGGLFGPLVSWRVQVDAATFIASLVSGPTSSGAVTNPSSGPPGPILADGRTVVVPVTTSQSLTYTLRNGGNVAWPVSAGGPVRLGTAAPLNRVSISSGPSWLVSGTRPSAVSASGASVAPGATGTFALPVFGNNRPVGATTEVFQPVWEHKKWITGADQTLTVVRVNSGVGRLATVHAAPAANISLTNAINGTATLLVQLRNVGRDPWVVGSERLSAASTPLATASWPSSTQPPALARNRSRPAVSSVYPGEVGEWQVPISAFKKAAGTYPLSFRAADPTGVAYGPTLSSSVTVAQASFVGSVVGKAGVVKVPRYGTALTWFDVKNTGNVVWPVGGMLRSEALSGSASRHASWLSATRPGRVTHNLTRPGAADVRPGEVARFRFVLAGNGRTPRATSETFDAVWDGWTRMAGSRVVLSYQVV